MRQISSFLLLIALPAAVVACGAEKPTKHPSLSPVSLQPGTGDANPKDPGALGTPADSGGPSAAEISQYLDLLSQCGELDPAHPDQAVSANFGGLPYVKSGKGQLLGLPVGYQATVTPSMVYEESLVHAVTTTTAASVTTTPNLAAKQAQDEVALGNGSAELSFLPPDQRAALYLGAGAWQGVACTMQPSVRIKSTLGGSSVTASFTPPLPLAVSPLTQAEHYTGELAETRTFNVQATVEQSNNAALAVGSQHAGTVTVSQVAAAYDVTLPSGDKLTIGGDVAFEVQVAFETPAVTTALGLHAVTRYFIDTTKHVYKAIVVDAADGVSPPAVFIAK